MIRTSLLAVLASALLLVGAAPVAAQDNGWVIGSFDVEIVVAEDGTFTVIEEIAVDFGALERRGIFRTIPTRYPYDEDHERVIEIDRWSVTTSEGTPSDLQVTADDRQVEARIGDPDTYITGAHTYRIAYRVRGALNRFDTHDELFWDVTGHGWAVPIRQASATVVGAPVEQGTCFAGRVGSTQLCEQMRAERGSSMAEFRAADLLPGHGLSVVVAFSSGVIDVPPPMLEEPWTLRRAFIGSPLAIPLTVLVAVAALVWFVRLLAREGRDRVTRGGRSVDGRVDDHGEEHRRWVNPRDVPVRFRPPDDLRPAQLGVIIDETVEPVEVSATIVDLAVRGYLTIREEESRGLLRSRSEWSLRRGPEPEDDHLLNYERRLLDGLFGDLDDDEDEVALSDLAGEFHRDYRRIRDQLYDDAVNRGWFASSPKKTRDRWVGIGAAIAIGGGVLVWLLAQATTFALAGVPLVLLGGAISAAHRWMPHRTPEGSRVLDETLGFREFIATAEQGRAEFAEEEGIFTRYLPYAVVFGVTDKWAEAFAHLGAEAAAAEAGLWYVGPHGAFPDVARLSSGLSDMSAVAGSSLPTSPSSSGSSGFSSGGGFSGGGMGGGGGGGW